MREGSSSLFFALLRSSSLFFALLRSRAHPKSRRLPRSHPLTPLPLAPRIARRTKPTSDHVTCLCGPRLRTFEPFEPFELVVGYLSGERARDFGRSDLHEMRHLNREVVRSWHHHEAMGGHAARQWLLSLVIVLSQSCLSVNLRQSFGATRLSRLDPPIRCTRWWRW